MAFEILGDDNLQIIDGFEKLDEVEKIFAEYKDFIGFNLSFQPADSTQEEILNRYHDGKIFLAEIDGEISGCIAYHRMENDFDTCELKRFFVRDEYRGEHVGRKLIQYAIDSAKNEGYKKILLDTHASYDSARHLYESFGFVEIPAYYFNPLQNVIYYELEL